MVAKPRNWTCFIIWKKSKHANVAFLNRIPRNDDDFKSTLKWIAKDVHDIAMYKIFNGRFGIQLKPLKKSIGQNWLKTRGKEKKTGNMKGLALVLVSGLASVGTELNKNGIVVWKEGFKTAE